MSDEILEHNEKFREIVQVSGVKFLATGNVQDMVDYIDNESLNRGMKFPIALCVGSYLCTIYMEGGTIRKSEFNKSILSLEGARKAKERKITQWLDKVIEKLVHNEFQKVGDIVNAIDELDMTEKDKILMSIYTGSIIEKLIPGFL